MAAALAATAEMSVAAALAATAEMSVAAALAAMSSLVAALAEMSSSLVATAEVSVAAALAAVVVILTRLLSARAAPARRRADAVRWLSEYYPPGQPASGRGQDFPIRQFDFLPSFRRKPESILPNWQARDNPDFGKTIATYRRWASTSSPPYFSTGYCPASPKSHGSSLLPSPSKSRFHSA